MVEFLLPALQPSLNLVGAAGKGPLLVGDLVQAIEPVMRAANGSGVVVADADLCRGRFYCYIFGLEHA